MKNYVGVYPGDIDRWFNTWREFAAVENRYFREDGLHVYMCSDPKPGWQNYYRQRVKEAKSEL